MSDSRTRYLEKYLVPYLLAHPEHAEWAKGYEADSDEVQAALALFDEARREGTPDAHAVMRCYRELGYGGDSRWLQDVVCRRLPASVDGQVKSLLDDHRRSRANLEIRKRIQDAEPEDLWQELRASVDDLEQLDGLERGASIQPLTSVTQTDPADVVPTPWEVVNKAKGGLRPGELVGLSGSTGSGKSLILSDIAADHARRGLNVLILDWENTGEDLLVDVGMAAKKRALGFGSAKQAVKDLPGTVSIWGVQSAFITMQAIEDEVAAYEEQTGAHHPVVIVDPVDEIKDPETAKELGIWLAQEQLIVAMQGWMRRTKRCGYVSLQINRPGVAAGKKGQRRTGADLAGSFGRLLKLQNHFIIEEIEDGRALVVDKCRGAKAALGDLALCYDYVQCSEPGATRGFVRFRGASQYHGADAIRRERAYARLVKAIKDDDPKGIKGMVRETREGVGANKDAPRYAGMLGIPKKDFNALFNDAAERGWALQELDKAGLIKDQGVFSFASQKLTWVVFRKARHD